MCILKMVICVLNCCLTVVIFLPQTVLSNGMHHASYLVQCEYIPKFQCLALSPFFIFTVKDIAHFSGCNMHSI